MNKKQFQLNGYASLFGNRYEALFIYSKFGNAQRYSEGNLKLSSLNTKLVNKIISSKQLLSGSNYALREYRNASEYNFDVSLAKILIGHKSFVLWLDKNSSGDRFRLQNFIVSGLMLDSNLFTKLTEPLYEYIRDNALLSSSNEYLNFSNSLKMYLIFPVISFTFLNFLKLLLVPMQITFRFMDLIKNNKK